jgi:hypothetical protein
MTWCGLPKVIISDTANRRQIFGVIHFSSFCSNNKSDAGLSNRTILMAQRHHPDKLRTLRKEAQA